MSNPFKNLTRIGVFYDGNYFAHVSNYYNYVHSRKSRINVSGLHEFIRHKVGEAEACDARFCQIVDAHYFRGRLKATQISTQALLNERKFDDVLIQEGIVSHYMPNKETGERGIDVWLALETFELALHKRFDVCVIIACDSDFVPLVRKLNTLGTRVMLLGWDFNYVDKNGEARTTKTSQMLLEEVTYPVQMNALIDDRIKKADPIINGLFMGQTEKMELLPQTIGNPVNGTLEGRIQYLKDWYGFITPSTGGENLFFYYNETTNVDFTELEIGDSVRFRMGKNDRGPCAVEVEFVKRKDRAAS